MAYERNSSKVIIPELEKVKPLFSLRRLAEFFDFYKEDGKPANDTVIDLWHRGLLPPPDFRLSRKAVYWKHETIINFINDGGLI